VKGDLRETLHPAAGMGEIPSLFLAEQGASALQTPSKVSEDGRTLLKEFFALAPAPRSTEEAVIIHRRFRSLAPEAWKPAVRHYRYFFSATEGLEACDSLLVCGVFFPSVSSLKRAESQLKRIRGACSLPARFLFLFNELKGALPRRSSFENELISRFYDLFGDDSSAMSFREFSERRQRPGTAFVDLTPADVLGGSALLQRLLEQGATPLFPGFQGLKRAPLTSAADRVLLSPFHGIELSGESTPFTRDWVEASPSLRALERCQPLL
jgi:hypothetical protein